MVEYLGSDSHLSLNHPDTHRSLAKEEDKTTEEEILHNPLVRTQCDHYYHASSSKQKRRKKNNNENSSPLSSLPVDCLMATNSNNELELPVSVSKNIFEK